MNRKLSRLLASAAGLLVPALLSSPSFALDLPTPLSYDMGPFGELDCHRRHRSGPLGLEQRPSATATAMALRHGGWRRLRLAGGGTTGDIDLTNAMFIINSQGEHV